MSDKPTVDSSTLEKLFNLSDARIRQLAKEEIVMRSGHGKYYLWESVRGYIRFLQSAKRNQWDGDSDGVDGPGYKAHRARLTAAKADVAEIAAKIAKGEAHDAGAVEAVWTDMLMNCRSKLLSLPSKIAPKVRKETDLAVCKDLLEQAVHDALAELTAYDPTRVTNEYIQTHRLDVEPAAKVDGLTVG